MAEHTSGMSISAVSMMLDIPVPTIRSWVRRYGVPLPSRTGGKHRRFTMDEILQLRDLRDEISKGKRALDAAKLVKERSWVKQPGGEHVASILDAALRFDVGSVKHALDAAHEEMGTERVVQHVALPVLRDIGTLWEAGKCDVANEHLASQEIRVWMNFHLAHARARTSKGPIILTTGPKDHHTLGLEGFYLILAGRGWDCRVLGAQTPTASLVSAVKKMNPVAVVVTSHMRTSRRSAVESIEAIATLTSPFYAGNAFGLTSAREGVPGTYLGEDLPAAADRLEAALRS